MEVASHTVSERPQYEINGNNVKYGNNVNNVNTTNDPINTLPHILSPFSSPWVAWVMLGLPICAILAGVFQPAVIRQGFVSLFSKVERSYNDSPMNYIGQALLFVFRAGIVGMAIYLFTYNSHLGMQVNSSEPLWCGLETAPPMEFLFSRYMTIMGAVAAMEVVKYLVSLLLNYTFQLSRQFATLFAHYTYVSTSICCVLYPLLLLIIYFGSQALTTIGLCVMMSICCLVLFIKWIRVFFTDIASVVYVVLYILTIEVLPLLTLTYIFS